MPNLDIPKLKKIKKETVTETIINQFMALIEEGSFESGQQLPSERELASLLDVSRPSVREAMKVLQSMNIVDIRTGSGTYLKDNTWAWADRFKVKNFVARFTYLELIEARKVLEGEIACLAAKNATEDNKAAIREAFHINQLQLPEPNEELNREAFIRSGLNFHLSVAEAAQNSFLTEMLNTVGELLFEVDVEVIKSREQMQGSLHSHEKIMDAVLLGKTDRARLEMIEHLENIETSIKSVYP